MSSSGPSKPPYPGVVELEITAWAAGGRGLGRLDGRVWMVPGTMPGDLVAARIARDHGRWVEGRAQATLTHAPGRRPPVCPIQPTCGGCPMMIASEESQREAKRQFVIDALTRIGGLGDVSVDGIVPSPNDLAYRNKIELAFGRDPSGKRVLGYHRGDDPGRLVDVERCAVADERLQQALELARDFFVDGEGKDDPILDDDRDAVRLVLRASAKRPQVLIALRTTDRLFETAAAFAALAAERLPQLAGVVRIVAAAGRRGGSRVETLAGEPWIEDELLGIGCRVPAATFLQDNAATAEAMLASVVESAGSPRSVVELYGGVGGIGLALARRGARATIVDADGDAVACGRDAAERAGIGSATFVQDDVGRFLAAPPAAVGRPDLVIADPPRTGLGRGVAFGIASLTAPRIAMVSCDPATLARDLATLTRAGYAVDRVTPYDLFPQTAHVEAVAWLRAG